MKIYAPVTDANGVYASVRFVNGVGETDNPFLITWFRSHGYRVEDDSKTLVVEEVESETAYQEVVEEPIELMGYATKEPDFESMTPNELREWAKANGKGGLIKNTRNKEKLLELIRG